MALGILSRGRSLPNFGNAGEVENVISTAKTSCMARRAQQPLSERTPDIVFVPGDFDANHNRAANAGTNLAKLFEDIVGHRDLVTELGNFQAIARACREKGLDPWEQIPTNFVFSGSPGEIGIFLGMC